MTEYALKQALKAYDDFIVEKRIPESMIAHFSIKNGQINITLNNGERYSKDYKTSNYATTLKTQTQTAGAL